MIIRLLFLILLLSACKENEPLPYYGHKIETEEGSEYHQVRAWTLLNQDSIPVSDTALSDNIYITDFFFTSCPTICPKLTAQMARIQKAFKNEPAVKLVSFTVDPKRDDVPRLKEYSTKAGAIPGKWHFLTGHQDTLHDLAVDYLSVAREDNTVPGGFDHSGRILLIDTSGHIRAFANGTDPEEVNELINKTERLLNEMDLDN